MTIQIAGEVLFLLFFVALLAGFIDTLAGGGGLIVLPALLMVGVPPLAALGTNKLQGSFGTGVASLMMLRKGRVSWREVRVLMLVAFVGSVGGSVVVQFIEVGVLRFVIPVVLMGTALYFLLSPGGGGRSVVSRGRLRFFRTVAVPGIGWYDGMFGPGTGSFFSLAGASLRGQDLVQATAVAKPLNFATNIASLLVFLFAGKVVWLVGAVMIGGQLVGAWLGSHCLVRISPRILRALVVVVCLAMLGRYGWSQGWW